MSERRVGKMIVGTLFIALACWLLFLVPSAFLIHKGQSRWLALAAGLAAFPLVPVTWHLLAERRHKRSGAKGALTGGDRFVMRLLAVALIAVVPLLGFARRTTWKAVKKHPTWYLHWAGGDGGGGGWSTVGGVPVSSDARLLAYVPGDAEWVVWMRATEEFQRAMTRQFGQPDTEAKVDPDQAREVLIAGRRDGLLIAVRAATGFERKDIDKAQDEIGKRLFGGKVLPLVARDPGGDVHLLVTQGWDPAVGERAAGRGSEPKALVLQLQGAPPDAPLVAAAYLAGIEGVVVDSGSGSIRIADQGLVIDLDLKLASDVAAATLRAAIAARFESGAAGLPESCREPVGKLIRGIDIGGDGAAVVVGAKLKFEDLFGAMFCQLGAGGGGQDQD